MLIKAKPIGVCWMIPAGWRSSLPGAAGRTPELLPESRLMDGANMFTLLDRARLYVSSCNGTTSSRLNRPEGSAGWGDLRNLGLGD